MAEARLTTRGRVTLPPEMRKALQLVPGDRLRFKTLKDGTVVISRADRQKDKI